MATGDLQTNFADKRVLPQQRLKDTFFDYLDDQLLELTGRVWSNQRGVFGTATLVGGADKVSVSGLPVTLLDGNGRILTLDGTDGTDLAIENTLAATYDVAARYTTVPDGVVRNPRTGAIDYDTWRDAIGELDFPDSVVETAGQLDMIVDSIFESGVSHAGRLVTVYLQAPVSAVEAVAIERNVVVTWDGTNNRILTGALLGQAGGAASTSVNDYAVVAQGLTIRRNTSLSALSPYAFIGVATGAGSGGTPSVSMAGQIDVTDGINPSLDEAYNNSGAGAKTIQLDDGAVELLTPASATGDGQNAQLRLVRLDNTEYMQFQLQLVLGDTSAVPIAVLEPVETSGGELQAQETVNQVAPDVLNFTRGGSLDLTSSAARVSRDLHVVLLESGPQAGTLYVIKSVASASQLTVMGLQSSGAPSPWTAGTGLTARILVPRFIVGNALIHQDATALSLWRGALHVARDGQANDAPFRLAAEGMTATSPVLEVYNGDYPRSLVASLTAEGKLKLGEYTPAEVPAGFELIAHPHGTGNADKFSHVVRAAPLVQLNNDLPTARVAGLLGEDGLEYKRFTPWGRTARTSDWFDDMFHGERPSTLYEVLSGGSAAITYNTALTSAAHGGVVLLDSGGDSGGDYAELQGPRGWVIDDQVTPIQRIINFYARLRLLGDLDVRTDEIGIATLGDTGQFFFRYNSASGSDWTAVGKDGGTETTGATGQAANSGSATDNVAWVEFMAKLDISTNVITFWMTGMTTMGALNFANSGANWNDNRQYPFVRQTCLEADPRQLEIDTWNVWDDAVKGGPKE